MNGCESPCIFWELNSLGTLEEQSGLLPAELSPAPLKVLLSNLHAGACVRLSVCPPGLAGLAGLPGLPGLPACLPACLLTVGGQRTFSSFLHPL